MHRETNQLILNDLVILLNLMAFLCRLAILKPEFRDFAEMRSLQVYTNAKHMHTPVNRVFFVKLCIQITRTNQSAGSDLLFFCFQVLIGLIKLLHQCATLNL